MQTDIMKDLPSELLQVCKVLAAAGFEAWLVGGAVRDLIMGQAPHDWDVATNARPEQVQKLFMKTIPTGIRHGTITVQLAHGSYEVTTYRGDGSYSDGRRPDAVSFLDSIDKDLSRRDFTINAIAYDPLRGEIRDPFQGVSDIKSGMIRAVGNPLQRFSEDGIRCLRAARFAATLGFDIELQTAKAIRPSLSSYKLVSHERIRDEWLKAMRAVTPSRAFQVMLDHGLLSHTVPEFLDMVGCKQNRYHEYDVWGHSIRVMDALSPTDPILRLAGLLHDVAKPKTKCFDAEKQDYTFLGHDELGAEMTAAILDRLHFQSVERERVCHLVNHHMLHYSPQWQDKAVRRWVTKVRPANIESLFALAKADIIGKGNAKTQMDIGVIDSFRERIMLLESHQQTPVGVKSLAINGNDLMKIGIPQGPMIGQILQALLDSVIDDPSLNRKDVLLDKAKSII